LYAIDDFEIKRRNNFYLVDGLIEDKVQKKFVKILLIKSMSMIFKNDEVPAHIINRI